MLGALGSLFFVLVLNFFLFRVLPGDPARTLGRGRFKTEAQLEAFRAQYGLDQPLPQQFLTYLQEHVHRRPRRSRCATGCRSSDLILDRLWPTLLLVGTSTVLAMVIGVYLGVISAWNRGKAFDKITTGTTLTLYSMPEWWLGLLLIAVFAVGVGPAAGHLPDRRAALGRTRYLASRRATSPTPPWHLVLPVTTLILVYLAEYSLIMRSSLLDELGEDYLTTARAKGLRDVVVRRRHAVRNALLPTTTLIALLSIGFVVSGAITVETVFSIPGLGLLATEALTIPDYWVLQGTFLVTSAGVIVANLLANLVYGLLDPRVRT